MKGFPRALRSEFYVALHRRPMRWAHVAVLALAAVHVVVMRLLLQGQYGDDAGFGLIGEWNFWPQFASAARVAMYLGELLVVVLVASNLPREIGIGAVRDPLSRGLSRSAVLASKALVSLILPLSFYLCALVGAGATAGLLFEAGDSIEDGIVRFDEQEDIIPVVRSAVVHAVLPLLALASAAFLASVLFARSTAAVGTALVVLFLPTVFGNLLGDRAPWLFADVLPSFGPDSFLQVAARWSAGYNDAFPASFDRVVSVGWISPVPAVVLLLSASLLRFRTRAV